MTYALKLDDSVHPNTGYFLNPKYHSFNFCNAKDVQNISYLGVTAYSCQMPMGGAENYFIF